MNTIVTKIRAAREFISKANEKHLGRIAISCSFSNIVLPHLARNVVPDIPIFSVMTRYMPPETFRYFFEMDKRYGFKTTVYMVRDNFLNNLTSWIGKERTRFISSEEFELKYQEAKRTTGQELYVVNWKECCRLLKLVPQSIAVKDLDAWISGLRIPKKHQPIEKRDSLLEYMPLLNWNEIDIWKYMAIFGIPVHPYYAMGYRSLGCQPCTTIIDDNDPERAGRWQGTKNCGGECGMHKKVLKSKKLK